MTGEIREIRINYFTAHWSSEETEVQSQVELYQRLKKCYLMPPCLTLSIIRYGSRVKWSKPGKEVVPSPSPKEKEAFGLSLTTVANCTYFTKKKNER